MVKPVLKAVELSEPADKSGRKKNCETIFFKLTGIECSRQRDAIRAVLERTDITAADLAEEDLTVLRSDFSGYLNAHPEDKAAQEIAGKGDEAIVDFARRHARGHVK